MKKLSAKSLLKFRMVSKSWKYTINSDTVLGSGTVGAAMILKNVSVFTPKPSEHYLNITMRNVVEVFRKDTVLGSGTR
ncbi:GPCR kinase [Tanacetum coccineum]